MKHFVAQRDIKVSNVALRTTALFPVTHTEDIQGNSYVPPELPNSAAQQPRQTQQKGTYQ